MNLERLLIDQGTDPLTNGVNGAAHRAFINGKLKRLNLEAITATTPSDKILELIYGLDDSELQAAILNRPTSVIRSSLNYRRLLSYSAVLLTILALSFFVYVVKSDKPLTAAELDVIKQIGQYSFDVIKLLLGQSEE